MADGTYRKIITRGLSRYGETWDDVEYCSLAGERLDGTGKVNICNLDDIPIGLAGDYYYYRENHGYHGTVIPEGRELGFCVWTNNRVYFPVWNHSYFDDINIVSISRNPSQDHLTPQGPRDE